MTAPSGDARTAESGRAPVELLFLWHHHQPDYRDPATGGAVLPWVRLHGAKDYLDMALHLERHPTIRATFNFVPSLLDQLDDAVAGRPDALFDLLRRPLATLNPAERAELVRRGRMIPPHARQRWPVLRRLLEMPSGAVDLVAWTDARLLALTCWFLLAWIDPTLLGEPEAVAALATGGRFESTHRDALLALHARLVAQVLPAYRRLRERGQIELSCSPYNHPILPLLVDVGVLSRARPDLPLPAEPFAAPADADRQIQRARARHERAFGAAAAGMWPSEGSVSPEAVAIAAGCGVRWLASDEGVLWRSLPEGERRRGALYRPWRFATPEGEVTLFFRDHELSDRIGFVYQKWDPAEAARDLVARVRRLGAEHGGEHPALVSIMLDGENCWEGYPDDGAPFLTALYDLLATCDDIRTRTPADVLGDGPAAAVLERLHSGSWIDADFHIWAGSAEKNHAWEHLARARRALIAAPATPQTHPAAWESLERAEGSDWFWWFGDDHHTDDKTIFDELFRAHLRATYAGAGLEPPTALQAPIARLAGTGDRAARPIGFISPVIDGRSTQFYEWHGAGRVAAERGGSAMHRPAVLIDTLYYGYDAANLYLRLDLTRLVLEPAAGAAAGALRLEFAAPHARTLVVTPLTAGGPVVRDAVTGGALAGAECRIDRVLEMMLPFAALELASGDTVELVATVTGGDGASETLPAGEALSLVVPGAWDELQAWNL